MQHGRNFVKRFAECEKVWRKEVAKEMKDAASLGDMVSQAADWFEGRIVLLVCDKY